MKTVILAVTLLAAGPASAYGTHMDWNCAGGLEVQHWENQFGVVVTPATTPQHQGVPHQGAFKLRWDFHARHGHPKLWLNGKACTYVTDKMHYEAACKAGEKEACDTLEENWPHHDPR